ncbi:hypothetical protein BH10PLA1_BH10PLA1_12360 [soil metagenome]
MIKPLVHVCLLVAMGAASSRAAPKAPEPPPYVPLSVRWQLNDQLTNAVAVFPHPEIPDRVYLATTDGLLRSNDSGKTFSPLGHASAEQIGAITDIAFRPDLPEQLILATHDHGLWISTDGGQTLKPLAGKSSGLASDSVAHVYFAGDDRLLRTLLAVHGDDAAGVSRSTDNGKTWQILFPDQHVFQIYPLSHVGKQLLMETASDKDPESRKVYYLASLQEPWQKLLDDVFVTGAAVPGGKYESTIYLSTSDKGIFRIAREGGIIKNVGPADQTRWASLNITRGSRPTTPLLYAYQPTKLGMVTFTPEQIVGDEELPGPPYETMSDGLFTGPLVMDGAQIRASSDGTAFFAVVNRTFYRSEPATDRLCVTHVNVTPAAMVPDAEKLMAVRAALPDDLATFINSHHTGEAALQLKPRLDSHLSEWQTQHVSITAEVHSPAADPVDSVTVDVKRFRRAPDTQMYDDGQHDDGKANDGVYGAQFNVDFTVIQALGGEQGLTAPECVPIAVRATSKQHFLAGAVGSLTLAKRQDAIPFVMLGAPMKISGDVTGKRSREEKPFRWIYTISIASPGDWSTLMLCGYGNLSVDITGQEIMSFWIRCSQQSNAELTLQLRDTPTYSRAARSQPVKLMAEGFIPGGKLTPTDIHVQIPVSRLVKDCGDFQPSITGAIILTSHADKAQVLTIHDVQFQPATSEPGDGSTKTAE